MNTPTTAAPQALGYSQQYTCLTMMLLEAAEHTSCSLEVFDDVAEQVGDVPTKLVQCKSSLGDNPVSDHAVSLWKTLYNWLRLATDNLIDPQSTRFQIYVSRPVNGGIIDSFNCADTEVKARKALDVAKNNFWGAAPSYVKRNLVPTSLEKYVTAVLEAPEDYILPILVNLDLKCGSGSPQSDLETLLRKHPVSEHRIPNLAGKLCGWVKRLADLQLEKKRPAVISRDEFHKEYVSYVRAIDRENILKSLAPNPSAEEQRAELSRLFVRQLEIIGIDYDMQLAAISDYLRACYDRTIWGKEGDVHESSFDDLDLGLSRAWETIRKTRLLEQAFMAQKELGQLIYLDCVRHRMLVQGMTPPEHFIPGCFHLLADVLKIGWHPEYQNILLSQASQKKTQ